MVILARNWDAFGTHSSEASLRAGLIVFALLFITLGMMMGIYRGAFHQNLTLQIMLLVKKYFYTMLLSLALVSFLKDVNIDRRAMTIFFSTLFPALILLKLLLRAVNRTFQRIGLGLHPSLVVGDDESAMRLISRFEQFPDLGYRMVGLITKNKLHGNASPATFSYDDLDHVIKEKSVDRIFIPSAEFVVNGHGHVREACKRHHIKLKVLSPEAERLLSIARVYEMAGITLISPPRRRVNKAKRIIKRSFDSIGAFCIILLLSPIFVATIVGILIESGMPIFFLQKRASIKGGKEFYFIKFRSMINRADELKDELQKNNHSDGALFKMKYDPRVTKVGKFIRKYSIDELPQLFNVLKGDMSLVGPRPLPVNDFVKAGESDEFWKAVKDRASVKPGMTGLWQVSGRSDVKFRDMILLDLYYVENYSLMFDLEILFQTIPAVLFGKGAY